MIDTDLQRFHYGEMFVSYSIINGDTVVAGYAYVPPAFTLENLCDMLVQFAAELAAAYPAVTYLTNFPGSRNVILAQALVTFARNYTHHEFYYDRERVTDCETFCDHVMGCQGQEGPWSCRHENSPLQRVATCVAIREVESMRPMLRYHPIVSGVLQEVTFERPDGPCHITMDASLSARMETHAVHVDESGTLHYQATEE